MFMAIDAAEECIIARDGVAFVAAGPLPVVCTGEYREISGIVYSKFSWFPTRPRGMAFVATGREADGKMIGRCGSFIVILVAGIAFGRDIRIVAAGMADAAIEDGMSLGEGKE